MGFGRTFFSALAISACVSALAVETHLCGRAANAERLFAAREKFPAPKPIDTWSDTDVISNELDIEAVHATSTITGFNRMTIRSEIGALNEFTFRLADTFTSLSATLNGQPITLTRLDPVTVRANFSSPMTLGQIFVLQINYGGPATAGAGFGSINFTTQGGQPLIFTLSEPYYSYTWWPSKDDNDDKALNSINVTVPNTMKVAANGRFLGTEVVAGNKLKYKHTCTYPMADYLLAFSATNYNEWALTYNFAGGSMPVRFMINPASDTPANRTAWGNCVGMIAGFEPLFGFYPFRNDQYGIYQFGFSGGMEHQTFTGQSGFGESLTSHELGHQWWGDMVTCRTWHDIWLNEGFATYCEALWLQYKPGSTGFPALKSAMASRKPTAFTGTVYRTDISSTSTIFSSNYAYRKGSWILHMYRRIVGEQLFWQTLANWRGLYQYASATTEDFETVAEQTTGTQLDWFFDPWIYQIGAIRFSTGTSNLVVGGQNYLLIKINQSQSATYPVYRMPVDVRFTDSGGTQNRVITLTQTSNWFVIPTNGAASGVTIDPDGWVLTSGTNQTQTFTAGPPTIISVWPRTGTASDEYLGAIKVKFHSPVNITTSDVILKSNTGINISIALIYDAPTNTATIFPSFDGNYSGFELTVKDTVTAVDSGMSLDGDVSGPTYAVPSGNGAPGGNAVFRFGY